MWLCSLCLLSLYCEATVKCTSNQTFAFAYYTGAPPTDVMLQQIGISMVRVTWTAPAFVPSVGGYQARIALGSQMSDAVDEQGTSADVPIITGQYGMYVAQVMSLSQHLPGQTAGSEEVAVLGEDY